MTATVKVTSISTSATEQDLWEFFNFSGEIESIQMEKVEETFSQTAYVTFVDEKALETALLLTGAVVVDSAIAVEPAVGYVPPRVRGREQFTDARPAQPQASTVDPSERAEEVVTSLLARGYVLSSDAMANARALDERLQLSRMASERAAALSQQAAILDAQMGISEKVTVGVATVREQWRDVDERYGVTDKSRVAFAQAEQSVNQAAAAMMKNQYFASGSAWLSSSFSRLKEVATDVSQKTREKVQQRQQLQQEGGGGNTYASARDNAYAPAGSAFPASASGNAYAQPSSRYTDEEEDKLWSEPTATNVNFGEFQSAPPRSAARPGTGQEEQLLSAGPALMPHYPETPQLL